MKRLRNHLIGVEQGELVLFSDFEDEGEMWVGRGQRERRRRVAFDEAFRSEPVVHVGLSMWDLDNGAPARVDIAAETVTEDGFDIVFRTWGDTRVARVRARWMAIGELRQDDDWEID